MAAEPNRLIGEKSPYLQQHAYNPVDWHPWGEEAFEKARREGKPIFLSIGYSTCHWCHVMERESFSNPGIADILNANFVPIKVDREERPDIDRIYMTAVQIMTGQGGWPLSAFLTPELKPFFGGTYFPPDSRWGRPGFADILGKVSDLWRSERSKLMESGDALHKALGEHAEPRVGAGAVVAAAAGASALDPAVLEQAHRSYRATFDEVYGGFSGAPKFPMPVDHNFLLRYWARTGYKDVLEMSLTTLRKMARGGIQDQIGGGFHRYSTDERWHVPHFEKMLYDNAQLAVNYLEAYQISKDPEFADTARGILDYVLRDMTHPEGGFYSAEDADSLPPELAGKAEDRGHERRVEGAFYLWTRKEILDLAGPEAGEMFCQRYGVEENGNAREDPQGEFRGKNILYQALTVEETAGRFRKLSGESRSAPSLERVQSALSAVRQKVFEVRAKRPRPQLDDKILASWNGLMIAALAKAGRALADRKYLESAGKAARFIERHLYDAKARRLYRRWREGERKIIGVADDYAFMAHGLIELYEASFDPHWLEWAEILTDASLELFFDAGRGGFYMTAADHDARLLARVIEDADNVEPSASSVAALNLLRLARMTGRRNLGEAAEKTLKRFTGILAERPRAMPQMLVAWDSFFAPSRQIVIAGKPGQADAKALLRAVHERFLPGAALLFADGGSGQAELARRLPFLDGMGPVEGRAAAYVCENYACKLPVTDPKALGDLLDRAMVPDAGAGGAVI